jgi:hypothetical protein
MDSKGRRWARLGAGVLIVSAGLVADRAVRTSLERRAREVDLVAAVRGIGLDGCVSTPSWEDSRLRWLLRPALRLRGVQASVLSGRPGPGAVSGRIRLEAVDLVPRWGFPLRPGLDRVEIRGGVVDLGRDLLPQAPRSYVDPISGAARPIPWSALLRVIEESGTSAADPSRSGGPSRVVRVGREPAVLARDLDIRLPTELFPEGEAVHVREVRLFTGGDRLELAGELSVQSKRRAWSVPVRFLRDAGKFGEGSIWDLALGSDSSGVRVRVVEAGQGGVASWSGDLRDPGGMVAQAFLDGRDGPLGRLRWEGPWSLHASGEGWRMSGVGEAAVRLRGGFLSLAGAASPRTGVSGTVRILPGRIDVSRLVLRDRAGAPLRGHGGRDSAEVQLQWLSTTNGLHLTGKLAGTFDPGWIGILGQEWSAAGRMNGTVSFEGRREALGGGWTLMPRGRMDGSFTRLRGPWFADSLTQGTLDAWGAGERVGFVLAGIWGSSPFRLEARDLPLADPRRPDYARAETRWEFTSPVCRIEDFSLDRKRFPTAHEIPFWLALPGRGAARIDQGSVSGVAFDSLSVELDRSGRRFGLEHLDVLLGGGRLTGGPLSANGRRSEMVTGDTRLEISGVDLKLLRPLLARMNPGMARGVEGTLSGTMRLRWPSSADAFAAGVQIEGSLHASDGSLRGLPIQEELRRRTHLDRLSVLSFALLEADVRRDAGTLRWNRLRVEAPPLRIEGAGRLDASDSLRCVLSIRSIGEIGDGLGKLLSSLVGGENAALYAVLSGPSERPSIQVLSRSGYLRELDRLSGALPSEIADPPR